MNAEIEYKWNIDGYIRCKQYCLDLSLIFEKEDSVFIYGYGVIGRLIYYELKDRVNIVAFIDEYKVGSEVVEIPVVSVDSRECKELVEGVSNAVVLVTPTYYWGEIENRLCMFFNKIRMLPVCSVYAYAEIERFIKDENKKILLEEMIRGKKTDVKDVVIVNGAYGLLLATLYKQNYENSLFFLSWDPIEDCLIKALDDMGAIAVFIGRYYEGIDYDGIPCYDIIRSLKYYTRKYNLPVIGQDLFPYVVDYRESMLTIVEDGFISWWSEEQIKKSYRNIYDYNMGMVCFPKYSFVKDSIYVRRKGEPLPELKNSHELNLLNAWREKNAYIRNKIYEMFSFPKNKLEGCAKQGRDILLVVPSNYTRRECSEQDMVELCRSIIDKYGPGRFVIKPHPADDIDYSKHFEEEVVINERFPIELILTSNVKFSLIIGSESNALRNLAAYYNVQFYND